MPCIGPRENTLSVEAAYKMIMLYLQRKYKIQDGEPPSVILGFKDKWLEERNQRNAEFKEALRRLFELDAWEGF